MRQRYSPCAAELCSSHSRAPEDACTFRVYDDGTRYRMQRIRQVKGWGPDRVDIGSMDDDLAVQNAVIRHIKSGRGADYHGQITRDQRLFRES